MLVCGGVDLPPLYAGAHGDRCKRARIVDQIKTELSLLLTWFARGARGRASGHEFVGELDGLEVVCEKLERADTKRSSHELVAACIKPGLVHVAWQVRRPLDSPCVSDDQMEVVGGCEADGILDVGDGADIDGIRGHTALVADATRLHVIRAVLNGG